MCNFLGIFSGNEKKWGSSQMSLALFDTTGIIVHIQAKFFQRNEAKV
jgi:hypothetical protein